MANIEVNKWQDIAGLIDHSMLKPNATVDDIRNVCQEALESGFATVAVHPSVIPWCVECLKGSPVGIDASVGFPLGQNSVETKVFETKDAILKGADEIDFVINIVQLKAGNLKYIQDEMLRIKEAAGELVVKAIIETCYLNHDEKKRAAELVAETGLDFIKTSTGFGPGGARKDDIALLRRIVGSEIGVKAAGEMTSLRRVLDMIEAGASRIGTKFSVDIIREAREYFG